VLDVIGPLNEGYIVGATRLTGVYESGARIGAASVRRREKLNL
jgi:hypothetical protein